MAWFSTTLDVICIGSSSKDVFFPVAGAAVIDTPEDLTAQKKVLFELGGKYKVDDRFEAVGGVAANVSQGLSALGLRSACYTKVGDDKLGKWIIAELKSRGVSTKHVFVDGSVRSDLSAIIVLTESGERTIFHNRDANERLEIIPEKLTGADWFFISALNGDWQTHLRAILTIVKQNNIRLAINPGQHSLRENPDLVAQSIGQSDILVLNKDEAIELVLKVSAPSEEERGRINDERFLLRKLHEMGAKRIGLTDGKRGAWASDGSMSLFCAPIFHEQECAVDTTGAGDAFSSAFLAAWIRFSDMERALRYGIANGVNTTRYYGANGGLLSTEDIESTSSILKVETLEG